MAKKTSPWAYETRKTYTQTDAEICGIVYEKIITKERERMVLFKDIAKVLEQEFQIDIPPKKLCVIIQDMRRPLYPQEFMVQDLIHDEVHDLMVAPGWKMRPQWAKYMKDSPMLKLERRGMMGLCPVTDMDAFDIQVYRPANWKHLPNPYRLPGSLDRIAGDRELLRLAELMAGRVGKGNLRLPCVNNDCTKPDCFANRHPSTSDSEYYMTDAVMLFKGLCGNHPYSLYLANTVIAESHLPKFSEAELKAFWQDVEPCNQRIDPEFMAKTYMLTGRPVTALGWAQRRLVRLLRLNWPDQAELTNLGLNLPAYADMEKAYDE